MPKKSRKPTKGKSAPPGAEGNPTPQVGMGGRRASVEDVERVLASVEAEEGGNVISALGQQEDMGEEMEVAEGQAEVEMAEGHEEQVEMAEGQGESVDVEMVPEDRVESALEQSKENVSEIPLPPSPPMVRDETDPLGLNEIVEGVRGGQGNQGSGEALTGAMDSDNGTGADVQSSSSANTGGFGNGGFAGEGGGFGGPDATDRLLKKVSGYKNSGRHEDEVFGAFVDELQTALQGEEPWTRGKGTGPPEDPSRKEQRGRIYLIAQVQMRRFELNGLQQEEEGVVGARADTEAEGWPELVWIPASLVNTPRRLEMGDSLRVRNYTWFETESGFGRTGAWLHAGHLNYQATALEVCDVLQAIPVESIGLITTAERHSQAQGRRLKSADVVSPLLSCSMKVLNRHLPQVFDDQVIRMGTVLKLSLIAVQRPAEVMLSPNYVLPVKFGHRNGDELPVNSPHTIFGVEPTTVPFEYPFNGAMPEEVVQLGEQVIAAAVAAQVDLARKDQRRGTFVGQPLGIQVKAGGKITFSIRWPVATKKELVQLVEVWEPDTAVSCSVNLEEPIRKPCASGFVEAADARALQGGAGFELEVKLVMSQQNNAKDDQVRQYEELSNGDWHRVELRPLLSVRPLRSRMLRLGGNVCSEKARDVDDPAGRVLAIMLGRPIVQGPPPPAGPEGELGNGPMALLQGPQRDTTRLMVDKRPRVVFQQAPPGTGKTFSAAAIMVHILSTDTDARILAVAPPNVAVVKFVQEMDKALQVAGLRIPLLALFSGVGKAAYASELSSVMEHLLATTVEAEEFQQILLTMSQQVRGMVNRYVSACDRNPRVAQEAAVARVVREKAERRVVFCTLSFAEQVAQLLDGSTHVFIDEAGRAPYNQVISLLAQLPKVRKVMITGDRRQLSVHQPSLPRAVRVGFGLGTVVEALDASTAVDVTTLNVCYRSHPTIVRCVSAAFYAPHGEELLPGRQPEERDKLYANMMMPVRDVPLVLIHQEGESVQDELSLSSVDVEQSFTAMRVLDSLYGVFGKGVSVRCVCLYGGQAKSIQEMVDGRDEDWSNVVVTTCDKTQGHEADVTVVVTTCAQWDGYGAGEVPFWAVPERVDVAVSRAAHGMFVGNMLTLRRSPVWRAFLEKAMEETDVVTTEYLDVIHAGSGRYGNRGQLLKEDGRGVKATRFYERYRGGFPAGQGGGMGGNWHSRYSPYPPQGGRGRGQQRGRGRGN